MLIDSHCHLDFPELKGELDAVLARARVAGVGLMVTISTRVRRFDDVLAIAEAHDEVFCSVGTHPHNAAEEPDVTVADLVKLTLTFRASLRKNLRRAHSPSFCIASPAAPSLPGVG
jgi:TatD DNase family protein